MSSAAMKWAAGQNLPDGILKAVLKEVAWFAGDNGCATPSQGLLAGRCGLSERTIRTSLAALAALGLLVRQPRSKGRDGRTTDLITLSMHRQFNVTAQAARAAKALAAKRYKRNHVPVANNLQPEPRSVPTGTTFRGIVREQQKEIGPSQQRNLSGVELHPREDGDDTPPRVLH